MSVVHQIGTFVDKLWFLRHFVHEFGVLVDKRCVQRGRLLVVCSEKSETIRKHLKLFRAIQLRHANTNSMLATTCG